MEQTFKTGICANCGADINLHRFNHFNQCPLNGKEEMRQGKRQRWQDSFFEDSGLKKLHGAAPDMLEALEMAKDDLVFLFAQKQNEKFWSEEAEVRISKIKAAIRKAKPE